MSSVIDLMTRGRKRGFCGVLATQRISKLHKDSAAECNNKMIGRSSQDIDMKRASEELGFTSKTDMLSLRDLEAGEFYVFGPAISRRVERIQVGDVSTSHARGGAAGLAKASTPKPTQRILAMLPKLGDLPKEAAEEARTVADLKNEIRTLKAHRCTTAPDEAATKRNVEAALRDQEKRFKIREADILRGVKGITDFVADVVKRGQHVLHVPTVTIAAPQFLVTTPQPPAIPKAQSPDRPAPDGTLPRQAAHILGVLSSRHPTSLTRSQLATLAGVSPKSSTYANSLSILNVSGFIRKHGDLISMTPAGFDVSGAAPEVPTDLAEVRRIWKEKLPSGASRLFQALEGPHPDALSRDDLAKAADMSPTSSSFANYLSMLNTNGLITKTEGGIRLSETLFD